MRPISIFAMLVPIACADPAPSKVEYDDLARIVGAGIATPHHGGEVGALSDSATIARGNMPKGFAWDSNGLIVGEHFGLTYRYLVTCGDAGHAVAGCNEVADNAFVVASWGGELAMPDFRGTMYRSGTWNLVGIRSAMAMVTGSSYLMDQEATFTGDPAQAYRLSATNDLMMFVDMSSSDMMAGGMESRIAVRSDKSGAEPTTFDVVTEVTLVSSQTASITLDGTFAYEVDLDSGAVTPR